MKTNGGSEMEFPQLVNLFAPEGVWAILSLFLILYIIRTQEKRDAKQDARDQKYQDIVADLSEALKDLHEIKEILLRNLKGDLKSK